MFHEVAKLVTEIYDQPESEVFRAPVDWKTLNLPTYPLLIKNPMDLGTILSNYNNGVYSNDSEIVADVRQVWINCMIFNRGGSELYSLGEYFADYFENELRIRRRHRHLRATDPDAIPSSIEKKKLDKLLLNTDPESLGIVINYISAHSPEALSMFPEINDMVELNIDAIPPPIFREVFMILDTTDSQGYKRARRSY